MALKQITDTSFKADVLDSPKPVLVDFWAEWCGPCKMLGPILEELAPNIADKVEIVKMDIDKSSATAGQYGVRSVPTMILFKNGQPVSTKVGLVPKSTIAQWIESSI